MSNAEDYTWLLCHSLIAAKTDPRGFQYQDVYQPCTQTNKMCVTEQNHEMLDFLFCCCIDGYNGLGQLATKVRREIKRERVAKSCSITAMDPGTDSENSIRV